VQVNITNLIDAVQCYRTVRELRWPDGIACPSCASTQIIKRDFDETEPARQRYECHDCHTRFDDLTDTIFAGHHQPLKEGGQGTMEKERPPVFGMIERSGQVVINLLANVQQKTIQPLIKDTIDPGTLVYTDEYSIYARLQSWGYRHKHVNHGRGEFARDEEGDSSCAVGFVRIGAFHKRNFRSTWGSSSLFTTCERAVKRCWARSLSYSFQKTPDPNKSVSQISYQLPLSIEAIMRMLPALPHADATAYEMISSTRRFCCRPSAVLLEATGDAFP